MYFLWAGNDGCYPHTKDNFARYANNIGLKTVFQEERTHDYYVTMTMFFSYFQSYGGTSPMSLYIYIYHLC